MPGCSASLALHSLSNLQMGCHSLLKYFEELTSSNPHSLTVGGRYYLSQLPHFLGLGVHAAIFPPLLGRYMFSAVPHTIVKHDVKCHWWFWDNIIFSQEEGKKAYLGIKQLAKIIQQVLAEF